MVKVLSASASKMYRNSEQYSDCSNLLKADDPPLEELDPAILSCGLPAIILSEVQPVYAPPIRYTVGQLLAIRKAKSCYRRPSAADDPKISVFSIWKTQPNHPSNRRVNKPPTVHHPQPHKENSTAAGNSANKERQEVVGKLKYHHNGRENGFVGPRFRRNYEFSNSHHHVIVKSYSSDGDQHHHHHMQNTIIEEEPEWVTAGPTSRLDTIELRGFDDDLSVSQSSSEKTNTDDGKNSSKNSGKHISFYDELHHYEHVHAKKSSGDHLKPHDSSGGRENDIESVTTSNTGSPPPARSTPTKHLNEFNNMMEDAQKHNSGVNVNNFEEFMKFDSLLGSDSVAGNNAQSGSRFSKWFRRGGNSFNTSSGQNYDGRRNASYLSSDNYVHGNNNRYPADRNYYQQYHPPRFSSQANHGPGDIPADSNSAFRRLVDMMAQNRVNNNLVAQQQNLLRMLNKNQQSESLRRMLIKNTVDNASDANRQQPSQGPRVPTQFELQLHTQSIMQNALLRKKLQDQRKILLEQNSQIAEMAAVVGKTEPNAEVQQFVKSVSPNLQRSLSILSQTANNGGGGNYRSFNQTFPSSNARMGNQPFASASHHPDLSASLRQMLLPNHHQQQGSRPFGNRRRFEKRSVTWKTPN